MSDKDLPVVYMEGVIAHEDRDPDGDQFVLDGVTYDGYLEDGYVASRCNVRPTLPELIGEPVSIERRGAELVMTAKVFDQPMVEVITSLVKGGIDPELGFALAGVITEKEDLEDGRMLIKSCRIRSVGLIPVQELSDARCKAKVVDWPRPVEPDPV